MFSKVKFHFHCILMILLIHPAMMFSQHQFFAGGGLGRLTTGDYFGQYMNIGYQYSLSEKWQLSFDWIMETANKEDRGLWTIDQGDAFIHSVLLSSKSDLPASWPDLFGSSEGLKSLPEQVYQTQINGVKTGLHYTLLHAGKHELLGGFKAGINWMQFQYIRNVEIGYFDGVTIPAQDIRLVVPLFGRILDLSLAPLIQYGYHISEQFSLHLNFMPEFFMFSGDRSYKLGVLLGFKI